MSDKKMTAVDSIIEKINNVKPNEFCSIETIKKWCIEAKATEKTQNKDSFYNGFLLDNAEMIANGTNPIIEFENYYKETYEN